MSGSLLHLVGMAASLEEQEKLHSKVSETQQQLDDILRDIKEIDKEVCPPLLSMLSRGERWFWI